MLTLQEATAVVGHNSGVAVMAALGERWWRGGGCNESRVNNHHRYASEAGDIVVSLDFVKEMMEDFKNQKTLHPRQAFQIISQTKELLRALPSLVDISVPAGNHITVCGDVHGQFYDLVNIFELNGLPSEENPYLFNGDFVDRGSFSLEVVLTLFAFKCMCPSAIHLARGNHETKNMNVIYGFEGEVRSKLGENFVELFAEAFCCLPLAHVINSKVFVTHGGLFSVDGVKLSDIREINRFCEPPQEGLMGELLWSDPQATPRGSGVSFGGDVTRRFLLENNLSLVVRSHELKDEGYEFDSMTKDSSQFFLLRITVISSVTRVPLFVSKDQIWLRFLLSQKCHIPTSSQWHTQINSFYPLSDDNLPVEYNFASEGY